MERLHCNLLAIIVIGLLSVTQVRGYTALGLGIEPLSQKVTQFTAFCLTYASGNSYSRNHVDQSHFDKLVKLCQETKKKLCNCDSSSSGGGAGGGWGRRKRAVRYWQNE